MPKCLSWGFSFSEHQQVPWGCASCHPIMVPGRTKLVAVCRTWTFLLALFDMCMCKVCDFEISHPVITSEAICHIIFMGFHLQFHLIQGHSFFACILKKLILTYFYSQGSGELGKHDTISLVFMTLN